MTTCTSIFITDAPPTCFFDSQGSLVINGILLVVDHGIVPDQGEVLLKLLESGVPMALDLFLHCAEVHWMFDHI